MFMALVRPKFLGKRKNRMFGKSASNCALPSVEPLSTTIVCSDSRPSDFSRDSRQRRRNSRRLYDTTTAETRGGGGGCSGFKEDVKPLEYRDGSASKAPWQGACKISLGFRSW